MRLHHQMQYIVLGLLFCHAASAAANFMLLPRLRMLKLQA